MTSIKFQKRHFEFIAKVLRPLPKEQQQIIVDFANALQGTNAHFKRDKFLVAAGYYAEAE